MQTLLWIWRELISASGRRHLAWMVVYMVIQNFLFLIPSWAVGLLLDYMTPLVSTAWVIFAAIFAAKGILVWSKYKVDQLREIGLGEMIIQNDRRMTELFMSKGIGQYLDEDATLSSANVEKARGRVWEAVFMVLFNGSGSLLYVVISFLLLWYIYWIAGLIATIYVVLFALWALYLNQRISYKCTPLDAEFRRHNRLMRDLWDHVEWVLNTGRAKEEVEDLDAYMKRIIYESDRPIWLNYILHANWRDFVGVPIVACALAAVIHHVEVKHLSAGVVVPVFVWLSMLNEHLNALARIERHMTWSMPALRSMVDALTMPTNVPEKPDAVCLHDAGGMAVEMRDVTHVYGHGDRARTVLNGLSLAVRPGEKVGIVGPTGSGKSTIMKLLLRYMDPKDGAILYDGVDLRDLDLDNARRYIGLIPQDPPVMMGTLRRNLLFRVPASERARITDEDMWSVLELVQLADRERFVDGLDTRVGRNGIQLSGGQKQRLVIASAIVRRCRLMLIDEATSSLDADTERCLQTDVFTKLGRNTTAIIVTHRYSALAACDRIIVLRPVKDAVNGETQIEAVGTFSELLAQSETFARNAALQGMSTTVATA